MSRQERLVAPRYQHTQHVTRDAREKRREAEETHPFSPLITKHMDRFHQIIEEILSLYRHQLAFWDRLNLSEADLRYYDLMSGRIKELRLEIERMISAKHPLNSAA
jgi:hypothetical protein